MDEELLTAHLKAAYVTKVLAAVRRRWTRKSPHSHLPLGVVLLCQPLCQVGARAVKGNAQNVQEFVLYSKKHCKDFHSFD